MEENPAIGAAPRSDTQSRAPAASFTLDDVVNILDTRLRWYQKELTDLRKQIGAPAEQQEEKKRADIERQRHAVHTSRQSVSDVAAQSVNIVFGHQTHTASPTRASAHPHAEAALDRRISMGAVYTTVEALTAAGAISTPVDKMDASQHSRYVTAAKQIGQSVAKFHGSRTKDADRTVHEFVMLINAELDAWLGAAQQHGRLNLVVGRTEGAAQNWLSKKRTEVQKLMAAGVIEEALLGEWIEVQDDFVREMSKGVTGAMYEQQLRALKLRDKDGRLDIPTFIRRFDEITARLHPSASWTHDGDRSRMLAAKFEERLKYSGATELWKAAWLIVIAKGVPEDQRTLELWQDALLQASTLEEWTTKGGNQQRGRGGGGRDGSGHPTNGGYNQSAAGPTASLKAADGTHDESSAKEGEQHTDEGESEAQLNATSGGGQSGGRGKREASGRGKRNPHLSQEQVERLRAKKPSVCLSCYKPGHYSSDCKTPANRAPTQAELN
jgi:hypothetical protein